MDFAEKVIFSVRERCSSVRRAVISLVVLAGYAVFVAFFSYKMALVLASRTIANSLEIEGGVGHSSGKAHAFVVADAGVVIEKTMLAHRKSESIDFAVFFAFARKANAKIPRTMSGATNSKMMRRTRSKKKPCGTILMSISSAGSRIHKSFPWKKTW